MRDGYLTLGSWQGAPVRAHWTLPLGAFVFGGGRFSVGGWLGFCLLVLAHEIGHAILVRRYRCQVVSIDMHALGGVCRWQGDPTATERAKIAWGGVDAQLAIFVATVAAIGFLGDPSRAFTAQLVGTFTTTNLIMIAINLLPVPPLDGAEAWKLPRLLARRTARSRRDPAQLADAQRDIERELAALAREPSPATKAAVNELLGKLTREPGRKDN